MPINNVGGPGSTSGNPVSDAPHEHVATVRHGETVSDVALRHGVETRSLLEANPQLKDAYQTLNAGQEIRLPFDPVATPQSTQLSAADLEQVQGGAPSMAHKHLAGVKYGDITAAPLGDQTTKGVIQAQLSTTRLSTADLAQVQGGVKGESIADKHKDESPAEMSTEAVSLNFGKMVPTYTPQKTDGTSGLETTGTNPTIAQTRPDFGGLGKVAAKTTS